MKKSILILAGATLLFGGCAKVENENNEVVPEKETHKVILKASIADNTRVSADAGGVYSWQENDQITVFLDGTDGLHPAPFRALSSGSTTEFEGTILKTDNLGQYAFYPARLLAPEHSVSPLSFALASEYEYTEDATNMPMLGEIESNSISFKAVGGLLKIVVYNVPEDAYSLVFRTNKKITGQFPIEEDADENKFISTPSGTTTENNSITFNLFTYGDNDEIIRLRKNNMVFYIPLPVGTYTSLTFEFLNSSNESLFSKTASIGSGLSVGRNQIIVAPALNVGGAVVTDATLTTADIEAANLNTSTYPESPVEYTNSFGTWKLAAIAPNKATTYLSIRRDAKLSYVELPTFPNDIASVTLHGVVNGSENKYNGTVYFRSEANNSGPNIATGNASSVGADVVLTIPAGYKTGFIMSSAACLMTGITVKFNAGTPATIPVISYTGTNSRTVGAGKLNCNIEGVKLSNALDNLGITPVIDAEADWIASAVITGDLTSENGATLTISAGSYHHGSEARTGKVYLRATGAEEKVITVSQNPSIVNNPASLSAVAGNASFTVSWTGDSKVATYLGYYSIEAELADPTTGTPLSITNVGTAYSATPSGTVLNGTAYYIYVKVGTLTEGNADKYAIAEGWTKTEVIPLDPADERTATINFGNNGTKINSSSVTGADSEGNLWTVSTVGTNSFSPNSTFSQVGSKDNPATSITFSTTFTNTVSINSISITAGGYGSTAGNITLKVGDTVVGTGSLNETNDVTVSSSETANGNTITITITNISRGVKVYSITTKYQ